jgi:hypothetical protein
MMTQNRLIFTDLDVDYQHLGQLLKSLNILTILPILIQLIQKKSI